MSSNSKKPHSRANPDPAAKRAAPVTTNNTGRVTHDDRGNAIWEWATKLDNPTLSLAEDAPSPCDVVKKNPLGTVKGYSPYDSGLLEKKKTASRKKDLRRLSEWLKLKKQAESRKPGDE